MSLLKSQVVVNAVMEARIVVGKNFAGPERPPKSFVSNSGNYNLALTTVLNVMKAHCLRDEGRNMLHQRRNECQMSHIVLPFAGRCYNLYSL